MTRQKESARRKWWVVAAVVGITVVGASLVLRSPPRGTLATSPSAEAESAALTILPANPLTFHALRVGSGLSQAGVANGFSNLEGSDAKTTVVWSVDGREVHRGPELAPTFFRRGNTVEARVQSAGPDGSAEVQAIASTRILNAQPRIQSITVQRDRQDPRWLQAHVRTVDADDDPLTLEYRWSADGVPLQRAQGSRVLSDGLEPGQKVRVEVIASDGDLRSEPLSSQPVTLDNHPPRLSAPAAPRMERAANGDLVAHMTVDGSDLDGDPVVIDVVEAPAGFRWDSAENSLVWTVTDGTQTVDVTFRVRDPHGASAERTVKVRR